MEDKIWIMILVAGTMLGLYLFFKSITHKEPEETNEDNTEENTDNAEEEQ